MSYHLQEINRRIQADPKEFVDASDAAYAAKIERAARAIAENAHTCPIVLLSGPSGSGKTTTAMKIAEALCKLGFERRNAEELFVPNCFGQIGFADFTIRNNGANIRRLKKRLESVARLKSTPTKEYTIGEVRIVENTEANRLQVFFPEKPSETVRKELKSNGFRWASIAACWQSYLNERQKYRIERILKNETAKS